MALYLTRETEAYRFGVWKLEETEACLIKCSGLSEVPSMGGATRRLEYLAVRALAGQMGLDPTEIDYLPSGKPILTRSKATISISHTKGYVALALSTFERMGIDLEHRSERVVKVRQKFMHASEENRIQEVCRPEDDALALLFHWCAKESLFKAVPEEGIDFRSELRVEHFDLPSPEGSFEGLFLRTGHRFQCDGLLEPEFVLICSFSKESR